MNRKKIIIIAIIVLVLAGLAIALLLTDQSFFTPNQPEAKTNQNVNTAVPEVNKGAVPIVSIVTLKPAEQTAVNTARNFAERYASFSTDSQFLNLEEVKLMATANMQLDINQLKAEMLTSASGQTFYGVSSKALKTEITNLDEGAGTAQVTVSLQRSERKDGAEDFVYYQDLELSLVKSDDSWLVDSAVWQE
ncbi:MAG: hypothetical protein Q8P32_03755 [Candidatus Komeilibacteria bacterium]|nr:hypothetical protein [Candidatus Komeilibacteria bacterium]